MKLFTRNFPLGSYPYESIESATKMVVKLYEKIPFIPMLPKIDKNDTIIHRTLEGMPGIIINERKFFIKTTSSQTKKEILKLDKAYNHPSTENLDKYAFSAPFLQKFLNIVKKYKSPQACIHFTGPFSLSQIVRNNSSEQMLLDKNFRKYFIQTAVVKALWIIQQVKEYSPTTIPVIVFEEPLLGQVGDLKRKYEEINSELVTHMYVRIIEKLKEAGAMVGIQCFEKCDWKIAINAGIDLISFDAYNNPNNLCIIPEQITEFIQKGGKINWAIVPVMTENIIKTTNLDSIFNRLLSTYNLLVVAGVPEDYVLHSTLVSIQGNTDHLPILFAEKAAILSTHLANRIPKKLS